MRLQAPPRDVTSLLILRAITRVGWIAAGVLLVGTGVMVVDVLASVDRQRDALVPLVFLAAQLAALILMYLRPSRHTGVVYIVVSVACTIGYQTVLLSVGSGVVDFTPYLVNRPIVALCAIGAVTAHPIQGIRWTTVALVAGESASVAVHLLLEHPVRLGVGPLLVYALIVMLMIWIWRSFREQPLDAPDVRAVAEETRRIEESRDAEARAAAVVHDTVLSDLAALAHGRVVLADHERDHLRDNVRRLSMSMLGGSGVAASGAVDLDLLNVVSDLQWRGLTVEVGGAGSALSLLAPAERSAALWAIRAALENVLVHAETTSAELFIDDDSNDVTAMVVDQGVGFDVGGVGSDRLGLRLSIMSRVEDSGGRASLWSKPGVGTTVMISLPKERVRDGAQ